MRVWWPTIVSSSVIALAATWVAVTDPLIDTPATPTTVAAPATSAEMEPPPEVIPWSRATAAGTTASIDWGDRCDTGRGVVKLPGFTAPCFASFHGSNGGSTAPGVTATTIKVVAYQVDPNDPSAKMVTGALNTDPKPGADLETQRRLISLLSRYYERYGRTVELVGYTATGSVSDQVAAVADAETIARDLRPFAVLGGPPLTNAFADTLASRGVLCIGCTPGQPSSFYAKRSPYVWEVGMSPEQSGLLLNELLAKQLAGRPARHAGDPEMRDRTRVFGSLHITLGPDTADIARMLSDDLARKGVTMVAEATFADPLEVQTTGRDLITRLKSAGVTTVVYTGDPFAPITLTKIATEQGYFPEWVSSGIALIDTDAIPRFYDQQQWAHAFGLANLPIGRADGSNVVIDLYRWYYGESPPQIGGSAALLFMPIALLMNGIQLAGADLSAERIREALFQAPATDAFGSVSYGDRGLWPATDYSGTDDNAIVWWDPSARGIDEIGRDGTGMWQHIGGTERFLPATIPTDELPLFDPSRAAALVDPAPAVDYTPLR